MSFNKTFVAAAGTGVTNGDQMAAELEASDRSYADNTQELISGHQVQLAAGIAGINTIAAEHPDKTLVGSVHGHANRDGSGQFGGSYNFQKSE